MPLKVLSALDTAKIQYYHFKATIVAGMGLFTDAYDLFCIPPIMKILGYVYYHKESGSKKHQIPPSVTSAMVGIPLLGTVLGQLVFGRLGDRRGRRSVYGLALMLMVLSSIGCGLSFCRTDACVLTSLGFFRFLLGIGIGGDYPLSATIMSEFANKRTRGAFIGGVFCMQGFGILCSSTVTLVVVKIFERASKNLSDGQTPAGADVAWRVILMLGAVPAALTYYWRMMMPETARYTALVENNVLQAAKDMEKVLDVSMSQIAEDNHHPVPPNPPPSYTLFSKEFLRRHGLDLFSCSITWLLLDVVFYSSNLFQSRIYTQFLTLDKSKNVYQKAFKVASFQAIVAICFTIPGYFFTVFFIDRIGRRKIQIGGFLCMGLVYFALGLPYSYWGEKTNLGFMFLYGLTFFFANFGPNTTTFIVPAELFPARFRSTCHGISGAMGKLGAVIGAVGFSWASSVDDFDQKRPSNTLMTCLLVILGVVCLAGMAMSYLFTRETMGRSLEENENDDGNTRDQVELPFFRYFRGASRRSTPSFSEVTAR